MAEPPLPDPEHRRRAYDVFKAAFARPVAERAAFLAAASLGDDRLRQEVQQLLSAHEAAGKFLEVPAAALFLSVESDTAAARGLPDALPTRNEFHGTDRYAVVGTLGAGGMGVVYEVRDRARDQFVALKTLQRTSPADLYHLKREFRGLSGIAHPNLVSLHELVVEESQGFFTMELVNGINLVDYVRGTSTGERAVPFDSVRSVFQQLADGLWELHRNGKLHRDIKPSNVLVTPEGRVVILDFGLIADVVPEQGGGGEPLAGTPAYIAPEDISGERATEASDWYSVGITLYQALTGRVPFEGRFDNQLRRKREEDPPPPSQVATGVPDDLSAICMNLISRNPNRRLFGRDALRKLAQGSAPYVHGREVAETIGEPRFVGRKHALAVLNRAFLETRQGRQASVYVHGPSGIGKSALIRRFLDRLPTSDEVVVLRARCYEQESVPYNAVDGIVDSLSQHLAALTQPEADALLPQNIRALARLFPVLLQVGAIAATPGQEQLTPDAFVLRQRAFAALRELLGAIAERHPVVFYIDDLHWADQDSAILLEELLRPPGAPAFLTILCFRSEETSSKPFLQALLARGESASSATLSMGPMKDDEARELIMSLIPSDVLTGVADWQRLAREAAGIPFFLEQLARHIASGEMGTVPDQLATFADMLGTRLRALPDAARLFLDTLAVCGRPMAPQLVHEACGLSGDERPLVASLRSARLVRSSGSAERVVVYHDRIRQTVATQIPAGDLHRIHRAMARTLAARRADDAEAIFEHYVGADDRVQASTYAALAAQKASAALAFDRAAFFYRRALELTTESLAMLEWKKGLATALANAGRPAEAAELYVEAATGAGPAERIGLQQRAANQFLIGGHIDRGLEVVRTVLAAVSMRLASGPRTALASLVFRRAHLRWRGLDFVERPADRVSAEDLLRIDTCWSVVSGLAMVDIIRAADFQTRHLLLALDAGEPSRLARALASEAAFRVSSDSSGQQRSVPFVERARTMAEKVGDPHTIALSTATAGLRAFLVGEWRTAAELCERAIVILRDQCVGATWEMTFAQNFYLGSLLFRGELREVAGRLPVLLSDAQERGNLYFETELRTRMNLVWLVADDPDEGERHADDAMKRWSHEGFHRQHYNHALARIQTALYRGDANAAWRLIDRNWAAMERTFLLRTQFLRIDALYLRARSALLMASRGGDTRKFLSLARGDARRIARERAGRSDPLSWLLNAAVAGCEGRRDLAVEELERAATGFDRADMPLYAAVTRRRLGALIQGDRGRDLVSGSEEWMAGQDVRNPSRLTGLLAPGFE